MSPVRTRSRAPEILSASADLQRRRFRLQLGSRYQGPSGAELGEREVGFFLADRMRVGAQRLHRGRVPELIGHPSHALKRATVFSYAQIVLGAPLGALLSRSARRRVDAGGRCAGVRWSVAREAFPLSEHRRDSLRKKRE